MARIRHLARAPVVEAVIDFQVRSAEGISAQSFVPLADRWASRYPVRHQVQSMAATFGLREGKPIPPGATYAELGLYVKTRDERSIVQLRTDGFATSQLPQYTSWEEVFPETMALWGQYRELARPSRLTRLAVRYINRLRFPLPADLSTYLAAPPTVPETLPQTMLSYLTRVVLGDPETGNSALVTQAAEPSVDANHLVVLLDIDVFRDVDIDAADERVVSILESLRRLKNVVFFGSITERTAEMYE